MSDPETPANSTKTKLVGVDGKVVELEHSKLLRNRPWYAQDDTSDQVSKKQKWESKRDIYSNYTGSEYKKVIADFQPKSGDTSIASPGRIFDPYARVEATSSKRDRSDTAHYLKNLNPYGGLEFDTPTLLETDLSDSEQKQSAARAPDVDVFPANHTSIFGSWYKDGKWGFKCCHQFDRNSQCTKKWPPTS